MEINELAKSNFPSKLGQLHDKPKHLYVAGDPAGLNNPCLAIVGSRKISPYGRAVTEKLAAELARQGITIISGLALGVDSVAHTACLAAGGTTIAILPTPLGQIYPASHRNLAKQIVESGGALIGEYSDDDFVGKVNFVARNRIVAALADAVLITEAALKSGSLHTARFALELGRDVLAVPGNITSLTSEGTNNLLKHGAVPVTSADDVLFAMNLSPKSPKQTQIFGANDQEKIILELIASEVSDGAELLEQSGLTASDYNQTMTGLEITGKIRALGANKWTLG